MAALAALSSSHISPTETLTDDLLQADGGDGATGQGVDRASLDYSALELERTPSGIQCPLTATFSLGYVQSGYCILRYVALL